MFGIINYGAFVGASVLLCLTPGIDTIYILTRTFSGGRREGFASALGVSTGLLFHAVLAALGLSAIVAASPTLFMVLKVAGALYLVYLGIRSFIIRSASFKERLGEGGEAPQGNVAAAYRQGAVTNILNPKIILFNLAFLPQFVSVQAGFHPLPFLLLGLTYVVLSTIWTLCLVFIASPIASLLKRDDRAARIVDIIAGIIYILLGISVFFMTGSPS